MNGYLESHAKTSVISLTLNTIVPSTSGFTRNCFGYLSNFSHSALTDQKSFNIFGYFNCLIPKPSCSIVSFPIQCFSSQRPPFQTIFLNERFAAMYGLSDGVEILLEPIQNLQKCTSIEFMPLSYEDWNIIEQSAYQIEEFLLHQIRVVQQDMRVILFLGTSISIKLRVESTSPPSDEGPALVMSTDTLVLVAPLKNSSTNIWNSIIPKTDTGNWSILQDVEDIDSYDIKPFIKCSSAQQMFRVLPASFTDSDVTSQLFNVVVVLYEKQDRTVYSKAQIVKLESYETQLSTCAVLIQLASPTANFIPQNSNGHDDVLLKLAGNLLKANENNKVKHCWISPAMSKLFSDCTWLSVDYLVEKKELQKIERLEVPFYSQQLQKLIPESLQKSFTDSIFSNLHIPYVMPMSGQDISMNFAAETRTIKIKPHCSNRFAEYAYIWSGISVPIISLPHQEELTTSAQKNEEQSEDKLRNFTESDTAIEELSVQTSLLDQMEQLIKAKLCSRMPIRGHILLTGGIGSGKSFAATLLARRLYSNNSYFLIFSHLLNCRSWKGQSVEFICKSLSPVLDGLETRQPSVLFLDNFDFVNCLQEDEYQLLLVQNIYSKLIDEIFKRNVLCICCVESAKKMPDWLSFPYGRRLFSHQFEIEALQKHQQLEVLSSLLNVKLASDTIEKDINFNIGELVNIAQSVAFKTANKKDIRVEDVQEAIQNMPTAGQPVQKCRDDKSICFADIAGLHEVKQKLVEIFIWPNKYAQLFANCGIAMGRGVILHGPSGCGKSMLMRALACECNFNVITIKGPELLSKYIGQSEENVRKVFERARASRPCILAFDEFDSLAPVRGHDSTGVTDRVVNQLLTEMDGVESGMEGLFVLAATNRIALIDQALLRPGRFDHKVLVDLPNEEDRLAILQIHSSGLFSPSNSDVNLFQIAKATDGWSGSELRGLLVNAHFQMLAEEDTGVNTPTNGQLQQKHLEQVFQSSAPKSNRRKENAKPSQKSTVNPKRVTQA